MVVIPKNATAAYYADPSIFRFPIYLCCYRNAFIQEFPKCIQHIQHCKGVHKCSIRYDHRPVFPFPQSLTQPALRIVQKRPARCQRESRIFFHIPHCTTDANCEILFIVVIIKINSKAIFVKIKSCSFITNIANQAACEQFLASCKTYCAAIKHSMYLGCKMLCHCNRI